MRPLVTHRDHDLVAVCGWLLLRHDLRNAAGRPAGDLHFHHVVFAVHQVARPQEAAAILDAGKAKIAAEMAELRGELEKQTPALAVEIASRVLGREVRS